MDFGGLQKYVAGFEYYVKLLPDRRIFMNIIPRLSI